MPLIARAQTGTKTYRLGLLNAGPPITDESPFGKISIRGLAEHGYELGENLQIEQRGDAGQLQRLPQLLAELAAAKVDAVRTSGYPNPVAAKSGTTIPVVAVIRRRPGRHRARRQPGASRRQHHRNFRRVGRGHAEAPRTLETKQLGLTVPPLLPLLLAQADEVIE